MKSFLSDGVSSTRDEFGIYCWEMAGVGAVIGGVGAFPLRALFLRIVPMFLGMFQSGLQLAWITRVLAELNRGMSYSYFGSPHPEYSAGCIFAGAVLGACTGAMYANRNTVGVRLLAMGCGVFALLSVVRIWWQYFHSIDDLTYSNPTHETACVAPFALWAWGLLFYAFCARRNAKVELLEKTSQ